MRRACLAGAMLLTCLGVRQGLAQSNQVIRFENSQLAIRVGTSASMNLIVDVDCQGVSTYDITLFYDAARIQLSGATAIPSAHVPAPTITVGTDSARIVSSGGTGFTDCGPAPFVNLTFAMSGGATTGSLVSIRVNHMIDGTTQDVLPFIATGLLDVCQGIHSWGDLDDNGAITSRDALIALTAAVGLPTPGFIAANADVDEDLAVTARDALFILSDGIGLGAGGTRVGQVIPNHCAPLAPTPSDLTYWTDPGLMLVAAGDTIATPVTLPLAFDEGNPAHLSPNGNRIAFGCFPSGETEDFCTADRNGANPHSNFAVFLDEVAPVWSPNGSQLAFVRINQPYNEVWVVDSSGSNAHAVATAFPQIYWLGGWSPTGNRVAFASNGRIWVAVLDSSTVREAFPTSGDRNPNFPSWSPAGDSLAYVDQNDATINVASVLTAAVDGPRIRVRGATAPTWGVGGIAFMANPDDGPTQIYIQLSSGRILRLARSTNVGSGNAALPAFR